MKPYRIGFVAMLVVCLVALSTCDAGDEYVPEDDACSDAVVRVKKIGKYIGPGFDQFTYESGSGLDYRDYEFAIDDVCVSSSAKFEFTVIHSSNVILDAYLYVDGKAIRLNRKPLNKKGFMATSVTGDFYHDVEHKGGADRASIEVKIRFKYSNLTISVPDVEYLNNHIDNYELSIKYYELK